MKKKIILFAAIALTALIGTIAVAQIFRARPIASSTPAMGPATTTEPTPPGRMILVDLENTEKIKMG